MKPDRESMPELCAWQAYPEPTIAFCETRTCEFPSEPANAWSNLAYVFVGIYVLVLVRRERRWPLWPAGVTSIGIGIGSFAFHAFPTFYTEYADLTAMYLLSIFLLSIQMYRIFRWRPQQAVLFYAVIVAFSTVGLWVGKNTGIAIFGTQVVLATLSEIVLYRRAKSEQVAVDYTHFWTTVGAFVLSLAFWVLDLSGLVCDPHDHLWQGHAAWHIINSTCLYFLFCYARQFDWSRYERDR